MEYKVLEIPTGNISLEEKEFINGLNHKYSANDIKFEFNDDILNFYLRQIDFSEFKNEINGNADKFQHVSQIIEKIENIKSYGLNGKKRLYVGYNDERKVQNRTQKEQKREGYYYTNGHHFSQKNNDLPKEFLNQIICADSEQLLKQLPDNCIDLIFTSPPYNFGLDYKNNEDDHHWENYFEKLFGIFRECIRVTKFGGRIIVNTQPLFSDYIPSHHIISNFFMQNQMIWKGEILWEKNNYNCKYTSWGSWKSPSSPYLKYTWEFLEIFCKGTLTKKGDSTKIDISDEEFKKNVVAKWSIAPERKMKDYGHPAMFPEELVNRSLKLFSYVDDIILDPFNGVGTTTYVAKILNRNYLGIDISEEYTQIAKNRIDKNLL